MFDNFTAEQKKFQPIVLLYGENHRPLCVSQGFNDVKKSCSNGIPTVKNKMLLRRFFNSFFTVKAYHEHKLF